MFAVAMFILGDKVELGKQVLTAFQVLVIFALSAARSQFCMWVNFFAPPKKTSPKAVEKATENWKALRATRISWTVKSVDATIVDGRR